MVRILLTLSIFVFTFGHNTEIKASKNIPYWAGHKADLTTETDGDGKWCELTIKYTEDGRKYSASVEIPDSNNAWGGGSCEGLVDQAGNLERKDCTPGSWSQRDLTGTVTKPVLDNVGGGSSGGCKWKDKVLSKKHKTRISTVENHTLRNAKKKLSIDKNPMDKLSDRDKTFNQLAHCFVDRHTCGSQSDPLVSLLFEKKEIFKDKITLKKIRSWKHYKYVGKGFFWISKSVRDGLKDFRSADRYTYFWVSADGERYSVNKCRGAYCRHTAPDIEEFYQRCKSKTRSKECYLVEISKDNWEFLEYKDYSGVMLWDIEALTPANLALINNIKNHGGNVKNISNKKLNISSKSTQEIDNYKAQTTDVIPPYWAGIKSNMVSEYKEYPEKWSVAISENGETFHFEYSVEWHNGIRGSKCLGKIDSVGNFFDANCETIGATNNKVELGKSSVGKIIFSWGKTKYKYNWSPKEISLAKMRYNQNLEKMKKVAEEKKRQELAKRAAEEKKRKELAKRAAEEKKRKELAKRAAEEKKRQEQAKQAAEEKKRQEQAKQVAEEKKRQEQAKQVAEEKKRRELAKQAAAEEKKRQDLSKEAAEERRPVEPKQGKKSSRW